MPRLVSLSSLFALCLAVVGCGDSSGGGGTDDGDATGDGEGSTGAEEIDGSQLLELGDYEVGFREFEASYRPEGATEDRVLTMRVWYPATPGSGAAPATYQVAGIVDVPAVHALRDAPLAIDGPYPVLVYSHGNGATGLLAYPYAELFASHGWITVAPNHTGNTVLDDIAEAGDPFPRIMVNRPADITASLDWLESGLAGDELEGAANTEQVLMFGHSFGGYTALLNGGAIPDLDAIKAACVDSDCELLDTPEIADRLVASALDPRIDAIAPQAPGFVPEILAGSVAGIEVPAMVMAGRMDKLTPFADNGLPIWEALDGPDDIFIDLPTGAHYTFVTICTDLSEDLLLFFRPEAPNDGCNPEFIPVLDAIPVMAGYLLAFGRQHALGDARWDAVIRGEPLHPQIEVSGR
jgi:predicted dienelactone hydrolase